MPTCIKCHIQKPSLEFYTKCKESGRLDSRCKDCVKAKQKEYQKKNPEVSKRAIRRYQERVKAGHKWKEKKCYICKTTKPAKDFYDNDLHKGRLANECKQCLKEKIKADPDYYAKRYSRNPARHRKSAKQYRERNRDKVIAELKEWRKRNPEKGVEYAQNRRARIMSAEGSFTTGDIKRIGEHQNWLCAWCSKKVRKGYHVDHIMPISKGGSNSPDNLQILCKSCNLHKHAKDPIEWANENGKLL